MTRKTPASAFVRPHINLGYDQDDPPGVNSVPKLVEFAASHNPDHIFGIQSRTGDEPSCEITFSQLQAAVEYTSWWLVLLLAVGLTPVAIAHLLKETSPSCVLFSPHVAKSSKEALSLLQSDGSLPVMPTFVHALGYDDLLTPDHDRKDITIPSMYTSWKREDLDAIIMHSSGTTGLPKLIHHGQTYPLMFATCHRLPEQQEPFRSIVSTLPLYHAFGFLAPHLSLSIGIPFILPPTSVIPTGKTTLQAIEASGARYLFTVPSILEEMMGLSGGIGLKALKDLEIVATGGAPMKESLGAEVSAAGVKLLNHW
ncbi:hypothetical protein C0992_005883, partial [Termitomyces sp. T32_za158]